MTRAGVAIRLGTGLIAASALVGVLGFAASLSSASAKLATGNASVGRCETDGVTVTQNLSGSNVASVTIGSISSACGNATISAAVNDGTASSSGSTTVPAGGGSVTVTLASAVAAKDADQVDVTISGP